MPQIKYNVLNVDPIGLERISTEDASVIDNFSVNSLFNFQKNKIELHIYSTDKILLDSVYNYVNITNINLGSSVGKDGASEVLLNPTEDAIRYEYANGGIITVYNFLNDLYSETNAPVDFYINEISPDRTELKLITTKLDNEEVVMYTDKIAETLLSQNYYNDFKLNFKDNKIITAVNIKTQDYKEFKTVVVKLYEPLPQDIEVKTFLNIEEAISDNIGYEIQSVVVSDEIKVPYLKGPNFNTKDIVNDLTVPSQFLNYDELFNFNNINSYRELKSAFAENSANLSIDYSNYNEFVHYSSAENRLSTFKYKLDLIENYQTSIDEIESGTSTEGGISGSREHYKSLIDKIITNFDHFDRHLYYESGSTSWPKVNNIKPYINATGSATGSWYGENLISSSNHDLVNVNQLTDAIPSYIVDDQDNAPYLSFVKMIGQHFDNIWIYSKAVTDKYDADNRMDKGVSRDLVQNVLASVGVKLHTDSRSSDNLFRVFTGQLFDTGSENINTLVSASNSAISEELYRKEIYKRIYHNLPLLLKSKGTEKGLRALVNTFGIPTLNTSQSISSMMIRTGGGTNTLQDINVGNFTAISSSLGKIRIDDTGSLVEGNTLSRYTSINKRNNKYTHDINSIEIGYSPTDVLNEKIIEYLNTL